MNGDESGVTNNGENRYPVVYARGAGVTGVLDGCTNSGGNADGGGANGYGGGMYALRYTSVTLANNTFTGNSAALAGGGLPFFDLGRIPYLLSGFNGFACLILNS